MKPQSKLRHFLKHNPLIFLLLFLPLTLAGELLALIAGVLIAALVSADGESSWLEGVALAAIYIILGLAFFLLPT
jgi:Ca2+:H+ antiporter